MDTAIQAAMAELGIDQSTLDDGSEMETEAETENTEVQEEVTDPEVETEEDSDLNEDPNTETGDKPTEENPEANKVTEEPKLTLKEFQEIDAAKKQLEAAQAAFKEETAAKEKEFQEKYHEKLKVHDQFDDFLARLAEKDPELFGIIKTEFEEHGKEYSNPQIEQLKQQNNELSKKLDTFLSKASDEVTRTKLDSDMANLKATLGKEAEAAGLKVNWESVEDAWADNPKLDLTEAFYAKYGKQLTIAAASKAKVDTVTKKVAGTPAVSTAGTVKRSNAPVVQDFKGMSTRDVINHFAKQATGKA